MRGCYYGAMGKQYWHEPKYLIIGGEVKSKYDGEKHRISGYKLVKLYGLREFDCVIYNRPNFLIREIKEISLFLKKMREENESQFEFEGFTVLRPREDGHYEMFRWFHEK